MNIIRFTDLKLFNSQAIRDLEAKIDCEVPNANLMKKAGKATAILARQLIKNAPHSVLILAGPGNNGGDACAAAADLAKNGYHVTVILCADPAFYSLDGKENFKKALSRKVTFRNCDALPILLKLNYSLVIDGLFGIGLTRPISGTYKEVVTLINEYASIKQVKVLSIDVPSGLNADTGSIVSSQTEEGIAIHADTTLTLLGNKPGLHTSDGNDYAGKVIFSDLDVQPKQLPATSALLNHAPAFTFKLAPRKQNSHKGSYGDVIVIGGEKGMLGAGILAARSALYAGAGKVHLYLINYAISYDVQHPEIMCKDAADMMINKEVVVIGPGMGDSALAKGLVANALLSDTQLVIDADALNLIAANSDLQEKLASRTAMSILTPHPLEAARLLQKTSKEIQSDRCSAALSLANKFNCVVILKGSGSIICNQHGDLRINTTGNPGLATGGTGDVLSGLCGSLLAQGLNAFESAQLATWSHGAAADQLVAKGIGPIGINASELPVAIRRCLNVFTTNQDSIA